MKVAHQVIRAAKAFWTALNTPKGLLVGAVGGYIAMKILAPAISLIAGIRSPVADAVEGALYVAFVIATPVTFYCLIVGAMRLQRFLVNAKRQHG